MKKENGGNGSEKVNKIMAQMADEKSGDPAHKHTYIQCVCGL